MSDNSITDKNKKNKKRKRYYDKNKIHTPSKKQKTSDDATVEQSTSDTESNYSVSSDEKENSIESTKLSGSKKNPISTILTSEDDTSNGIDVRSPVRPDTPPVHTTPQLQTNKVVTEVSKDFNCNGNGASNSSSIFMSNVLPSQPSTSTEYRQLKAAIGTIQSTLLKVAQTAEDNKFMLQQMLNKEVNTSTEIPVYILLEKYFCDTTEKLLNLDNRLKNEPEFQKLICTGMKNFVNIKKSLHLNIARLIKEIIHAKVLAENYVAHGTSKTKTKFTTTVVYNCIKDTIINEYHNSGKEIPKDNDFKTALSTAFNLSKDWKYVGDPEGNKSIRTKKKVPQAEIILGQ